jgi:hypothetical protein
VLPENEDPPHRDWFCTQKKEAEKKFSFFLIKAIKKL